MRFALTSLLVGLASACGGVTPAPEPASGDAASDVVAAPCGSSPWILTGRVTNARSVGGVPLAGGGHVRCAGLYRGPELSTLDDAGCAELAAFGIASVVDLRTADEQASAPDAACVAARASLVSAPLPIPYSVSASDYLADLHTPGSIAAAFRALGAAAPAPAYVHCTYGRDRTGIVTALVLMTLGASRDDIVREYMLSVDAGVGAYPGSLGAVLDEIEAAGGIEAYLTSAGVAADDIEQVRDVLAVGAGG